MRSRQLPKMQKSPVASSFADDGNSDLRNSHTIDESTDVHSTGLRGIGPDSLFVALLIVGELCSGDRATEFCLDSI